MRLEQMLSWHNLRDANGGSNLSVRPALQIMQQHDLPLDVTETLQRTQQRPSVGLHIKFGLNSFGGQFACWHIPKPSFVQPVSRLVTDNLKKPRSEARGLSTRVQALECQ
jgi:hypothetical protein